ncbi:ABC transporter permease [Dactylosporangium sp. NPDC005572]|uniref:ABC transporter permease n=1 Tax=Dactylosporangium sp. NPDC005572 TaxID=3156889 RepID=UPI0033AD091B
MRGAVAAEWTKLWTTRTVWWALAAAVVLMVAGAGQYALYAANDDLAPELLRADGRVAAGTVAVLATALAQFAVIALAMLVMTSEYSAGTIRATLAWVPSRGRLLLAKSLVVAVVALAVGVVLGVVGAVVAAPLLGDRGVVSGGAVVGDALAIGGYLALISVFATGLGAALRGPVATLVTIFLLVVVIPPILELPDVAALNRVAGALPGPAGTDFMRGDGSAGLVVAAWAVAALVAGWRVLRRRDA